VKLPTLSIVLLSLFCAVYGQENPAVDLVAELEDYYFFQQIEISDTLLFLTTKYGLSVYTFNEDDPDQFPVEIARYATTGISNGLFIDDSLCYLDDGENGLLILNVADLDNIHQLGRCEEAICGGVIKVVDDIAYLACGYYGLRTVDVSDPADPVMLDWYPLRSEDIRVVDDLVYSVSERREEIALFDISDPADIQLIEQFEIADYPYGIEVHNDYLFANLNWANQLIVISVEDPRNMELIYESNRYRVLGGGFNGIRYSGNLLYMGRKTIWNVRNPRNPILLSNSYYCASDLEIARDVSYSIYPANISAGYEFYIYDIQDTENPECLYLSHSSLGFLDVFIQGDNLYLSSRFRYGPKLVIFDISDMNDIEKIGEIDSTAGGTYTEGYDGIFIQNELAILYTWEIPYELNIFSLENIEHPEEIGCLERIHARDVEAEGDYIYVAAAPNGFVVVSVENPRNPEIIWTFADNEDYTFQPQGLDLADNYAYTVNFINGVGYDFRVWNKSNPEDVQLVGSCEVNGFEGRVTVKDEYAYVLAKADEDNLSVISIADPEHPEVVTIMDLPYWGYDCLIDGDFLYVSLGKKGFAVYSLDDPERPELLAWYDVPYRMIHLAVHDSYVICPNSIYDCARVTGRWDIQLSSESHYFGDVLLDTSAIWQLTIGNAAEQPVDILDISSDSAAFTVDFDTTFTIDPNEDSSIDVTFTPTEQRPYTSKLTIHTERRDLTVALSGTGVDLSVSEDNLLPLEFSLKPAYPNPFNSSTTIRFDLPHSSQVSITLIDLTGRSIATLIDDHLTAGQHQLTWNVMDYPAGIYLCKMEAYTFKKVIKMVLVR